MTLGAPSRGPGQPFPRWAQGLQVSEPRGLVCHYKPFPGVIWELGGALGRGLWQGRGCLQGGT